MSIPVPDSYIKRVASLERLQNSMNGNPRYRVAFTDGVVAFTQPDASFCHTITNSELHDDVVVAFTCAGRIADMRPA